MPNGQYPVITAGQDPTASLLQAFSPLRAWKLGDTARTSTITPSADPDLAVLVTVNAVYEVRVLLIFTGAATGTGDLMVIPTVPSGATAVWAGDGDDATSLNPLPHAVHTGFTFGSNGTSSVRYAELKGTVFTSSSTGAVAITWSQNTSNSTATTLKAGSRMSVERMS